MQCRGDRSHFLTPAPKLNENQHSDSCLHSENVKPRNRIICCSHLNQVFCSTFSTVLKRASHLLTCSSKTPYVEFRLNYLFYIVNLQDDNTVESPYNVTSWDRRKVPILPNCNKSFLNWLLSSMPKPG